MLYIKNKTIPLTLTFFLALTACNQKTTNQAGPDFDLGDGSKDTETNFNQLALVTHLTDNVISPTFEQFQIDAQEQQAAINAYCDTEITSTGVSEEQETIIQAKNNAQIQWRATMATWQQAEQMLLGPLLDNDGSLRNKIYSWPVVNTCAVDNDIMYFKSDSVNGKPYDIALRTPSRKGLAALDYLLFNDNLNHSCEVSAPPPGWNSLTEQEQKIARCLFAVEVAIDIENNAGTLTALWFASDGYANELKSAGKEGSDFISEHEAVNRISDAMFYVDSSTKDGKLATPLGLFANSCGESACPEDVESPYSQNSFNNIYNNLIGFEKLLTGEGLLGFTDYLIDVGDQATADSLQKNTTKTLNELTAVEVTLTEALTTDSTPAVQTHKNVKTISDQLKTDFITSLALELPATSAGDND